MSAGEVTDLTFEDKVVKAKTPVLVDFWAPWCGPCKIAGPVLDQLSDEYKGKIEVIKLNVDENPKNTEKYNVMSIPTTILFKGGGEVGRQVGFAGREPFENLIKKGL